MRRVKGVVALLLTAVLLLTAGCAAGNKAPSYYDELSGVIGQPLQAALEKLNLQEDDLKPLVEGDSLWLKTPIRVEYGGVGMDLVLGRDSEDRFTSVMYLASYENAPEQAAKDTVKIGNQVEKAMGKAYVKDEVRIYEMTEKALKEHYSGKEVYTENNFWKITDSASDAVKEYFAYLEGQDFWKEALANKKANFYMDFDVNYDPESNAVWVMLTYRVGADRGDGNYSENN